MTVTPSTDSINPSAMSSGPNGSPQASSGQGSSLDEAQDKSPQATDSSSQTVSPPPPEPATEPTVSEPAPESVPTEESAPVTESKPAPVEPITEVPVPASPSQDETEPGEPVLEPYVQPSGFSTPSSLAQSQPPEQSPQNPQTPEASQTSAQSAPPPAEDLDQSALIHDLGIKARSKIQEHLQKKMEKVIEYAEQHQIITNDEVQKLTRVSDATATRYLSTLVKQGRLIREGAPKHAKYRFLR